MDQIDLAMRALRVQEGDSVLLLASLESDGREAEIRGLVDSAFRVVGASGTIVAPMYAPFRLRAAVNGDAPGTPLAIVADQIASRPGAVRSSHPALPFVAAGRNAAFITGGAPFHFPLGSNSPLARLYQVRGLVLLLDAGHHYNVTVHLAENWADVPYHRRSRLVRADSIDSPHSADGADSTEEAIWKEMHGSPECSAGFERLAPVLRQARILREAAVGSVRVQSMRIQPAVSMAVEMLRGDPKALLCGDSDCGACELARRFTAAQE